MGAESETPPIPEQAAKNHVAEALKLRMKAIYHNCMSSACFAREDAEKVEKEDPEDARALRLKADAFEQVAGWLHHATTR